MNPLFDFSPFIAEANPEHWEEFPELMWNLGFEMDCYASAPRFEAYKYPTHTHKEIQDQILWEMQTWDTQLVGNYIFSRYRYLTHWCDYGYPEEEGSYFFQLAFPILEGKLLADWNNRNSIPSFEVFSQVVISRFVHFMDGQTALAIEFAATDEADFHIRKEYDKYLKLCDQGNITHPAFYERYVQKVARLLQSLL